MAYSRMNASYEFQRNVAQSLMKAILARDYSKLAMFIEMIARSINDGRTQTELAGIKQGCSIDFENFCILYLRSFSMPQHRGIRFVGTGYRLSWSTVRQLATSEFVQPLNDLSVRLMGTLAYSPVTSLQDFLNEVGREKVESEAAAVV